MIYVSRPEPPQVLRDNAEMWSQEYLEALANLAQAKEARNGIAEAEKDLRAKESRYRSPAITDRLQSMFNRKCAYCESYAGATGYLEVDHHRPKSSYPTLCFQWENLVLACTRCNGRSQKGDKFPTEQAGGPIIDPCMDEPSAHIAFKYDAPTQTFLIHHLNERGRLTISLLGLHDPVKRLDLIMLRNKMMKHLSRLVETNPADPDVIQILVEACQADHPFAACARAIADHHKIDWHTP